MKGFWVTFEAGMLEFRPSVVPFKNGVNDLSEVVVAMYEFAGKAISVEAVNLGSRGDPSEEELGIEESLNMPVGEPFDIDETSKVPIDKLFVPKKPLGIVEVLSMGEAFR